jgi:hypothetical protein
MSNNYLSQWLVRTMLAGVLAVTAMPSVAQAQSPDPSRGLWLASSANEASLDAAGRLSMADGELVFESNDYEWRLALSEIKRVGSSKNLSNAFEIESNSGRLFYIGILDAKMLRTSPGKAVQAIQRAVRATPAPAQARPALVAAAGGTR